MHWMLELDSSIAGNLSAEQVVSLFALAMTPREQQSQHSRKSSPPTKGMNLPQEFPSLKKTWDILLDFALKKLLNT